MRSVLVYSRSGCHLCEDAVRTLNELATQVDFELAEKLIDGNPELEYKYGEQVPVILIDGKVHDFFRVDPKRFLRAISE
jgi:glutaredoxin